MGESRVLKLRRPDTCGGCGAGIAAGERAVWDPTARLVMCLGCADAETAVDATPVVPVPRDPSLLQQPATPPTDVPISAAGASARAMGQAKRAAQMERRRQLKEERPVLGRLKIFMAGPAMEGESYLSGAVGEERVGLLLDGLRETGVHVLHDRRRPPTRANIDHIVVSANAVWIIDAKRYKGLIEKVDKGGWLRSDERLMVGGRDRSTLVEGMQKQVADVRAVLDRHDLSALPVRGALCFVGAEVRFFAKPFTIADVLVTWTGAIQSRLTAAGDIDQATRKIAADVLAAALPTAT